MKRIFLISLTVLIAALLMVACNMDSKLEDGLAILSFQTNSGELNSKSLTRTNPVLDPDQLYWSYTAEKNANDKTGLKTGEQKTVLAITEGLGLKASVGPFSYGMWDFTLMGYTDSDRTNLAYRGTTTVTLSSKNTTISVTVTSQSSGKGTLQVPAKGEIKLKLNDNTSITDYSAFVEKIYIKAADTSSSFTPQTHYIENSTATDIELDSGSYSVTVSYQDKKDPSAEGETAPVVYAEETIYVTIADYLTTKLGGDIKENNSQVEFLAQGEIIKATTSKEVETGKDTTLTVNASPVSAESNSVAETTVSIPSGAISGATEGQKVSIAMTTYSASAITAGNETEGGFSITSTEQSNPILGVLDIKLYVGDATEPTKEFSDNKVLTITTKVAKGLNGGNNYTGAQGETCTIQVPYNGEGAAGTVTSYNATTGELVFTVSHLSTYYVVDTNAVAYNSTFDTAYKTLKDAVNAADTSTSSSTIILLCDANGDGLMTEDIGKAGNPIECNKSITIDFNNHTYTATGKSVGSSNTKTQTMHWGTKNVSNITLKNGTFTIGENISEDVKMAMQNYIYLTIENMTLDFSKLNVYMYGTTYTGDNAKYNGLERPLWGNNDCGTITLKNTTVKINPKSNYGVAEAKLNCLNLINSTIEGRACINGEGTGNITLDSTSKITGGVVAYFNGYEIQQTTENGKTIYTCVTKASDSNSGNGNTDQQ